MTQPKAPARAETATKPENPGTVAPAPLSPAKAPAKAAETGGPTGPDPTRYGDWERKGRCIDF